jgi:hypothetical protein
MEWTAIAGLQPAYCRAFNDDQEQQEFAAKPVQAFWQIKRFSDQNPRMTRPEMRFRRRKSLFCQYPIARPLP